MKANKMYLRTFLLFVIALANLTNAAGQTLTKTFTFNFNPEDFRVEQIGSERKCEIHLDLNYGYGELGEPALPHIAYNILLPDNYRIQSFTYSVGDDTCQINRILFYPTAEEFLNDTPDTLTAESIPLPPTPLTVSGPGPHPDAPQYPLEIFPVKVQHAGNQKWDNYVLERFTICPFTYYAAEQKLVLSTSFNLTVSIIPYDNETPSHTGKRDEWIKEITYNPEDIGNGTFNWEKMDLKPEDAEISLHVENLRLADLITEGQKLSVKTLNITGRLTEDDYAFLREGNLPQLRELNLRKSDIQTIPKKAFYNYGEDSFPYKECQITLPEKLVFIGDSAFYKAQVNLILTGKFPKKGIKTSEWPVTIIPTEDNAYCLLHIGENRENCILSTDGKILYHANDYAYYDVIPEGVEIIAERAFEGNCSFDITFPQSLKKIEDYAFYDSYIVVQTGSGSPKFTFSSLEPPTLGIEVFSHMRGADEYGKGLPTLSIPETWKELYTQKDEQWKIFKDVVYWMPQTDYEKDPQNITEFSITGTRWYSNAHHENFLWGRDDYSNTTVCYSIGADTIYNEEAWKSFYRNDEYLGAIREQDGQVWFYPSEENPYELRTDKPTLLYDFSLQVGDVIYESDFFRGYAKDISPDYIGPEYEYEDDEDYEEFFYPITVKEVGEVCGRKVIKFDNGLQWIEGIGRIKSPFFSAWSPVPTDGSSSWEEMYQVESNGKTIYFNGEFANPELTPWMKEGMTWTQNWGYSDTSEGRFRQIMLKEEVRPGTFTIDWTESFYSNPYNKVQEFNGKVYAIDEFHYRFDLCYDFTLQEGDDVTLLATYSIKDPTRVSLPILSYDTCTVSKVDSVEVNDMMRKRITLTGDREDVWIEGVGSLSRVFPIDGVETSSSVIYHPSRISCLSNDEKGLYLHPDFIDCTTPQLNNVAILTKESSNIQATGSTLTCTATDAVKLEVYTPEAVKVGEARFANGTATVKVSRAPAMYLYIVTYRDGRRESGKVTVRE